MTPRTGLQAAASTERTQRPCALSLLVHTLDEETRLARCIGSARAIADEIVVVDTGSADGTRELAAALGARVFEHPPVAAVEFSRDFGLGCCSGEWVLVLDADETLTPALAAWIRSFVAAPPADVQAVAFARSNELFGAPLRGGSWWPGYQVRLLRRGAGAWGRTIHAQPLSGRGVLRAPVASDLAIQHAAYASVGEFVDRSLLRYTAVDAALRDAAPLGGPRLLARLARRLLVELVWKRGYRDGTRGVVAAGLLASYELIVEARVWERDQGSR